MTEPDAPLLADLWFDPWATSKGPALATLSSSITAEVLNASSKAATGRQRAHKAEVVERVTAIVSSIIANLLMLHCGQHHGATRLAVSLRHQATTRYDRKGFGQLPVVLGTMEALGHIRVHQAHIKKRRTGIEAAGRLLSALLEATIPLSEVGRAEGEETIWLTIRGKRGPNGRRGHSELIEYEDTERTIKLREEVERINAFLSAQCIELDGRPQAAVTLSRRFLLREEGGLRSFDLHGRLYGGFWLNMPKQRRRGLRINGEPIADLDFASMFPRLGYLSVGVEPPEGDLYDIPGLEGHRGGVKAGFSALFSTVSGMLRLPSNVKEELPRGWTAERLKAAIGAKHPALVPFFGRDLAVEFMFTESTILVAALLALVDRGVPALPMHDGMMVPASRAEVARWAMGEASRLCTQSPLPVAIVGRRTIR